MDFAEVLGFERALLYPSRIFQLPSDSSARTLQDVKFPDRAGGFSYTHGDLEALKNRFIVWRCYGNNLELQEESLDCPLRSSFIKFVFSNTSVVQCSIFDTVSDVEVLVCTSNSAARFTFHHPSRLRSSGSATAEYSIFHDSNLCQNIYPVKSLQPSQLRCASAALRSSDGHAIFAFGVTTGTILVVDMPESGSQEPPIFMELHQSSIMQKLFSGIMPNFMNKTEVVANDVPTDFCFIDSPEALFLVAICRDHKLRMWNTSVKECLAAVDLLQGLQENIAPQHATLQPGQGHRIRAHRSGGTVWLLVHLNLSHKCYWVTLEMDLRVGLQRPREALQLLASCGAVDSDVTDFVLTQNEPNELGVWTLSYEVEAGSTYSVKYTDLSNSESKGVVLLETCLATGGGGRSRGLVVLDDQDTQEAVISEVFRPGHFPRIAVVNALKSFRRLVNMPEAFDIGNSMDDLKEEVQRIMEKRINTILSNSVNTTVTNGNESSMQLSSSQHQAMEVPADPNLVRTSQWEKFFEAVCGHRELTCRPISLLSLSGGALKAASKDPVSLATMGLVRRWGISLFRPMQLAERLAWTPPNMDDALLVVNFLKDPRNQQDIATVLYHCRVLLSSLQESDLLREAHLRLSCFVENPSDIVFEWIETVEDLPAELRNNAVQEVSQIADVQACLEEFVDILECYDDGVEPEDLAMDEDDPDFVDLNTLTSSQSHRLSILSSPLATELLRQGVFQNTQARLDLSLGALIIVQLLHKKSELRPRYRGHDDNLRAALTRLSQRLISLTRSLLVIMWTTETRMKPAVTHEASTSMNQYLSLLGMCVETSVTNPRGLEAGSLLEELYQSLPSFHLPRSISWNGGVVAAISRLQEQVLPMPETPSVRVLCRYLLTNAKPLELLDYTRLLINAQPLGWWKADILFVRFCAGLAHLFIGECTKGVEFLCETITDLKDKNDTDLLHLVNEDGNIDFDELTLPEIQGQVFLKILRLVEAMGHPVLVVELANRVLQLLSSSSDSAPFSDDNEDGMTPTNDAVIREESVANLRAILWTRIFRQELNMDRSQRAFTAIKNNPDSEKRHDCLRQLVITLFERGHLQTLTDFDYEDLEEEFVSIVECRARGVDLALYDYYEFLFAFHFSRGNYRRAALAMYERAVRLDQEAVVFVSSDTLLRRLQQQARSYLACLNSLHLVPEENQWIVRPRRFHQQDEELVTPAPASVDVLELKELTSEYQLIRARLQIAKLGDVPATPGPLSPRETVNSLLAGGLYQEAVRVCQLFRIDLACVLFVLTERCVELSGQAGAALDTSERQREQLAERSMLLRALDDVMEGASHDCFSTSQLAWSLLQALLRQHDSNSEGRGWLGVGVARHLLSSGWSQLPTWLARDLERERPAPLLRLYLSHSALEAAFSLSSSLLHFASLGGSGLQLNVTSLDASRQWVPLTVINRLLEALHATAKDFEDCRDMEKRLQQDVLNYYAHMKVLSEDRLAV